MLNCGWIISFLMQPAWVMMTMALLARKHQAQSGSTAMPDHVRQLTVVHINVHFVAHSTVYDQGCTLVMVYCVFYNLEVQTCCTWAGIQAFLKHAVPWLMLCPSRDQVYIDW
ncbi:TPA: hypothetical protein ACH3X1_004114 [Trebouxia sp. C0004]